MNRKLLQKKTPLLFLVLMVMPFIWLQFKSSHLFVTHDGQYHIERTFNYVNSWREGILLPTWAPYYNNGFGSPILIFLFPVVYWVMSLLNLSGISLVATLKLTFILCQFLAGWAMYKWLNSGVQLNKFAALAGAMAYVYAPYSLAQVFARGTLREFAAAAIFPLVLLMLSRMSSELSLKQTGILALVGGLFLLTDGITVVVFLLLLVSYGLYLLTGNKNKKRFVGLSVLAGFLGVAMAGFIYLPFLTERQYLRPATGEMYRQHFVYWQQFFDPHWGFGFSMEGPNDTLSFQLGALAILAIGLLCWLAVVKRFRFDILTKILLTGFGIYVLLMWHNPLTIRIWDVLPGLKEIQLPWRLLAPTVLLGAYFVAKLASLFKFKLRWFVVFYMLVILISFKYLRTNQIIVFDETALENNTDDATAYHEFIPKWRDKTSEFGDFEKVEFVDSVGTAKNLEVKTQLISFDTTSSQPVNVRVSNLYFPGWQAYRDNERVDFEITKPVKGETRDLSGMMSINVPEGNHRIMLKMGDTLPRRLGKIISVMGLAGTLTLVFGKIKRWV